MSERAQLLEVRETLTPADHQTHRRHVFEVPSNCKSLEIHIRYAPKHLPESTSRELANAALRNQAAALANRVGASLADLQAQAKAGRTKIGDLRNALSGTDDTMSQHDIDAVIADWLDNPQFVPTRELAHGERVRVVLDFPGGTSETTVVANSIMNNGFLNGRAE